MKPTTHFSSSKPNRDPRGFALVVTLSLMILLTVIAVGLLSLSSISLRSSAQGQAMQTARANARMAMMLALGDLQKSLGPDARMSARAETLAKDSRVGSPPAANTPESWWVGVSNSDGKTPLESGAAVKWLVSGQTSAKITKPTNPVDMIRAGSLDLKQFTGDAPIQAGRVPIANSAGVVVGNYAYFVDDNGMKAQLAASHPDVRNDNNDVTAGILPGTHPLTQLRNLAVGETGTVAQVQKLGSTKDLELIGVPKDTTKEKFFAYTTRSQGVLSDSRAGGLKKDLTIAFEIPSVFSKVFPIPTGIPTLEAAKKFIAITPEKLEDVDKKGGDLIKNGYINWAIFRDYYNLKSQIKTKDGFESLAPTVFWKDGFVGAGAKEADTNAFYTGASGPHQMSGPSPAHKSLPYGGDYPIAPSQIAGCDPNAYRYNPIFPLLLELRLKSWLTVTGIPPADNKNQIRTNTQVFTSHYNPYNVGIYMLGQPGDGKTDLEGPRVLKYPQVIVDVRDATGSIFEASGRGMTGTPSPNPDLMTLDRKLQAHVPKAVLLEPGRSHIMGFTKDASAAGSVDNKSYSDEIQAVVNQSSYTDKKIKGTFSPSGPYEVTMEYAMREPSFCHGMNESKGSSKEEPELCQVFFSFLAWNQVEPFDNSTGSRPGKIFRKTSQSQFGVSEATVMQFSLRTTNEGTYGVRPLVDANIRATWNNPKWDSALELPGLAAYITKFSDDAKNPPNNEIPSKTLEMSMASKGRAFSNWGDSRNFSEGNDRVILFDVPRRDLVSLGQLQHAAAGHFSYEPTYIVGNSYANPRIPPTDWKVETTDKFSTLFARGLDQWKIKDAFNLYDASYLVNELIWDSYTFTTIPQDTTRMNLVGGDVTIGDMPAVLAGTKHLPNPRYIPYEPTGSKFTKENLQMIGNDTTGSFFHNAGHLMVDGSFNVNSTSVDAWEAFLTSTLNLPVRKLNPDNGKIEAFQTPSGVRYPRAAAPAGAGMKTDGLNANYWTGFRELTEAEVKKIANEIVTQIKDRGPFLTLGAFVNRKLESGKNGNSGALQAALDNTVNTNLDNTFQSAADPKIVPTLPANGNQGAGFPGQLLQGDVLQVLAPYMTVHSDTFTIRAYGEAKTGNTVTAKAYCEAVVQRFPDPVKSGTATGAPMAELVLPTSVFGRQFQIVSFRWMNEAEI